MQLCLVHDVKGDHCLLEWVAARLLVVENHLLLCLCVVVAVALPPFLELLAGYPTFSGEQLGLNPNAFRAIRRHLLPASNPHFAILQAFIENIVEKGKTLQVS